MAARKTSDKPTRIWKFAARIENASRDAAHAILSDAQRYYNRLCEIERTRVERFRLVRWQYAPKLGALEDEWTALDDQVAALYAEAKEQRADWWRATRGDKVRLLPPEYRDRHEALQAHKKAVSERAKEHREAFAALLAPARAEQKRRSTERAQDAGPRTKSKVNAAVLAEMLAEPQWHPAWKEIAASDQTAHAATLAARASCGLYGGTYLGVEEAFARAKKDSSPRPPAFRRFDSGRGKIQLQPRSGTTWIALSGERVAVTPLPPRPGASRRSNMIRIVLDQTRDGEAVRKVAAVCRLHRIPPADAEVKWVALVFRRVGRRVTCQLQLTLEHQRFAEPKRPAGLRAPEHVRIGWARVDGGIRVARWSEGAVLCPDAFIDTIEYAESIESAADVLRERAGKRIRRLARIGGSKFGNPRGLISDRNRVWLRRACEAYAANELGDVRGRWRDWRLARKAAGLDLYAEPMELRRGCKYNAREALAWWCWLWARKDRHLEQLAADLRRKAINRRDMHYRHEAIRIATEFEAVTVDSYRIDILKRLPPLTMPGEPPREIAQRQLQVSAPGRFREILREVMGPRCSPCERPSDAPDTGSARGEKVTRRRIVAPIEGAAAAPGE